MKQTQNIKIKVLNIEVKSSAQEMKYTQLSELCIPDLVDLGLIFDVLGPVRVSECGERLVQVVVRGWYARYHDGFRVPAEWILKKLGVVSSIELLNNERTKLRIGIPPLIKYWKRALSGNKEKAGSNWPGELHTFPPRGIVIIFPLNQANNYFYIWNEFHLCLITISSFITLIF